METQELELIKEEYRRLSQEIGRTLGHRLQIVQFGLAFVGAAAGYAFSANASAVFPFVIAVMIPSTCIMVLFLWLSEVTRTRRASWYMYGLERRVNIALGHRILRWEEDLRLSHGIFRFHYYSTTIFFMAIAIIGATYGMWNWTSAPVYLRLGCPLAVGILILYILSLLYGLRKFDRPGETWPYAIPDKAVITCKKQGDVPK